MALTFAPVVLEFATEVSMVIRRVGVLSVAKLYGAMMAAVGLCAGLLIAVASSIGSAVSAGSQSFLPFAGFGIAAIIVLPIFYAVVGFIGGLIGGALYNLFAGLVGGIEIETS